MQALISRLSSSKAAPINLYVSGPYDSGDRKWMTKYDTHVFVAGGIGVSGLRCVHRTAIPWRPSHTFSRC
jgi:hypothetical protein